MNGNTVALDISLSEGLISEGLAREVINRIQNLRKDQGFEVTDRIEITLSAEEKLASAINNNLNYICSETLADEIRITSYDSLENGQELELTEGVYTRIELLKR
jgi:isoleucyl-tRNA synthetase